MMYDLPATPSTGTHYTAESDDHSLVPDRISVAVDYWVIDETGGLADPAHVAKLPGASAGTTPHSIAVETPPTENCGDLREHLEGRLQTAMAVAHNQGCRLLPLGLRPDLLAEAGVASGGTDHPPPTATAGTRITFDVDPETAVDIYNILLALDPAFVLLNTTRWETSDRQYACGRAAARSHRVAPYRTDRDVEPAGVNGDGGPETDHWQPVRLLDEGRIEWRAVDASTPTLLVDLIADVVSILSQASNCRLTVESFGNGFDVDRLSLPTERWREIYTEQAAHTGVDSVILRAYLDRLGIETGWYITAAPAVISPDTSAVLASLYRMRAALLEADVGFPQAVSG